MLTTDWQKSARCSADKPQCVQVRASATGQLVHVRHSLARHDKELAFTREEWRAFVDGVKDGQFDLGQ